MSYEFESVLTGTEDDSRTYTKCEAYGVASCNTKAADRTQHKRDT
jgi:hypothetical protein